MKLLSLGHDSEFFVVNGIGDIIDPATITSGTKRTPEHKGGRLTWQADGMALEIGSVSGFRLETFADKVHADYISTHNLLLDMGFEIITNITRHIPHEMLEGEAGELGCTPDYNAYTARQNPKPSREALGNVRCVGRHLHIGATEDDGSRLTSKSKLELVKALDLTVGCGRIGDTFSAHSARSKFYGVAGSFRPKSYGVEYRVPSYNFLPHADRIVEAVRDAIDIVNSGELQELIELRGGEERVRQVVDSGGSVLSSGNARLITLHTLDAALSSAFGF